jgi:hypothetical protein
VAASCCDHGHITSDESTAEPAEPTEPADQESSTRFDGWRRRSAIGALATGIALGLKDIFQPSANEPVITAVAPGDPPDPERRLRVILDPDDPTKSVAILPSRADDGIPAPPSDEPGGPGGPEGPS